MSVAEKQDVALFFFLTFVSEPRHLRQPGFALGFRNDFEGSWGEQMGELKSWIFPREDSFFSNSRSTYTEGSKDPSQHF